MSIEVRGLIAGVIAALAVLGGAFGVSAIVRASLPPPSSVNAVTAAPVTPAAPGAAPALVTEGQGFYQNSCASCHGKQGEGNIGPKLQRTDLSDGKITSAIQNGIPPNMPAFGNKYDAHDQQAIVAYIHTLR